VPAPWWPDVLARVGTLAYCLSVVAAGVWVVVRTVTMWTTGHPAAVGVVVLLACAGGVGGWLTTLGWRRS